MESSDSKLMNT